MAYITDISADKNISNQSPIAIFAFMILFVITNLVMEPSFPMLIIVLFEYLFTQVFFQVSPRIVFLSLSFLSTKVNLSPNFEDTKYYSNEKDVKSIMRILNED